MLAMNRRSCHSASLTDMSPRFTSYFNPIVDLHRTSLEEEIVRVEAEITHLERHLLCRYQTAFQSQVSAFRAGYDQQQQQYNSPRKQHRSLADHLMGSDANSSNALSEEIVRCIAAIYCKFGSSAPSPVSPTSSLSSSSGCSSKNNRCDSSWSPGSNTADSNNSATSAMIHVLNIRLDDHTFNYAATMLQKFRSLVRKLEKVDPKKMKQEEKLAFWINIHNALLMHAYLAYGTGNGTKSSSVFKAAYNIGGQRIDAQVIQSSILGIRSSRKSKSKLFTATRRVNKHEYALEHAEPMVHFALSYGEYGDPVVRAYTGKRILGELRAAKEEFIKARVEIVHNNKQRHSKVAKVMVPRLVYDYAKDMSMENDIQGLLKEHLVDMAFTTTTMSTSNWSVHCLSRCSGNSSFGYIIHPNLATF